MPQPTHQQTPRPGNGSADRTLDNCQSRQSLPKSQPMVEDAPDDTEHDDSENAFANDDNFGDLEMQSFLDETRKFLQDTSTPETNFEDPAVTTEASFHNTDGTPENGLDPAAESPRRPYISSNSIGFPDPLSATSHEDVGKFDDDHSNSRKRKHDVASPEEYDGSTPSTPSHSSEALSDGAHAESAASYLSLPAEEDEEDLDAQGHFSQPDSRLASPSYEHSTEAIDDSGTQEPDPLGSIFSQLTLQQVAEVERTGDHLLLRNLAIFLEKYSGTWKVSGF